ncbi:MAG: thiamine-phosphate kinase [Alphaproteobacteria bacterium]|jgi:thiamine-monophosphate kinase|nr:thiamine-phosphate kinase [Alphaproteobacteria bacterium]MDP6815036.1 thiamine-phosphate kinase [Alphaproteobacteria bacterium]
MSNPDPPRLGEFDLIRRHFAPLAKGVEAALGLTDDAAVLTPTAGRQLVLTADAMIAGVHFLADDPAADVGAKLLRVNLSDLAAMGAAPLGYLMTTAWPGDLSESWIADFAAGLAADQAEFGIGLLGGDTVSTDGPLSLSLTAIGDLPAGTALRRDGAKAGDLIYLSGRVGDAGVGLHLRQDAIVVAEGEDRAHAVERFHRPRPRLALGQALRGLASACIDVSDGLVADLGHLARASGVGAAVELARVPLSPLAGAIGGPAVAITAGDDYELLFTVPTSAEARMNQAVASAGVAIQCIGRIVAGADVAVVDGEGRPLELPSTGYRHF